MHFVPGFYPSVPHPLHDTNPKRKSNSNLNPNRNPINPTVTPGLVMLALCARQWLRKVGVSCSRSAVEPTQTKHCNSHRFCDDLDVIPDLS